MKAEVGAVTKVVIEHTEEVVRGPADEDSVMAKIITNLAEKLVLDKMINISKCMRPEDKSVMYIASTNVAMNGPNHVELQENHFVVDGEQFSNDDLIEAVKVAYPERFV